MTPAAPSARLYRPAGHLALVRAVNRDRWRLVLLVLLGAFEVFLGADALPATVGELGLLGGALVIASVLAAVRYSRGVAAVLLILGAVPFAVLTWWSVVTPLIAVAALIIGAGIYRASPRRMP